MGNINLDAQGTGIVRIVGSDAIKIPHGDVSSRPNNPETGYFRFNTETQNIEVFDGNIWSGPDSAIISSEIITPNGTSDAFAISAIGASTGGVLVSINGTLQQPFTSYNIDNDQIIFTEVPAASDIIEIRSLSTGSVVSASQLRTSGANVILTSGNINVSGNLIPSAADVYSIGSNSQQWKDLYLSGDVVYSGDEIYAPSSNQTITVDSFLATVYRTAKYILQVTVGSEYQSVEILVNHNGTTAYNTVYGVINTGNILGNVSSTINSGNVLLQYTTSYNDSFIRLSKNYIVL